ncbi:glycosyltransferase family 39 protein [Pseudorhodoplanes sinuspersici]|uniref:glycosyltransferase family 39 protein n=1 Tax=Pseudorhodoplanes sinuspersici TaxID=1235591 RepID=UPI001FDAA3A3|nr:glycosyltransferase family 39 protein [Pseudorhodoplanes sinuspersici]
MPGFWRRSGFADRLAIGLLTGLCILAIVVFRDYGISNDEEVQHRYGELIINYYASGFRDVALFNYKNLYLYGGLFDIVAVLLAKLLPFDVFLIRHFLSAIIGVAGIVATWATARLIAGPRAGLIAAVALATCGPYFGGMFNHTKDIPFAAAMIGALYFLLRAARDFPAPRWRDVIGFGLMLGAATGLRAMGLLLIGYAGLLVVIAVPWAERDIGKIGRYLGSTGLRVAPAFVLGYLIMIAAWPWAALEPLNPLRAIFSFAHFHYEIRTIVAGEIYRMADVPRWYVPFYLLIKTPMLTSIGALCALAFLIGAVARDKIANLPRRQIEVAIVTFVVLFPIACEAAAQGPAFSGMRHFLFVVPPLAVLAGVGFDAVLMALSPQRWLAVFAACALSAAVVWNTVTLVRLHPYEYLFYNPLVGGLDGAARRYEMDYWVNMMPDAVNALQNYLGLPGDTSQRVYTVGVCGEKFSFDNYADKRLRASPGWLEADFFIAPTHMNCDQLVEGRTVATIRRLGVPIGIVKDRRGITQRALGKAF